MKINVETPFQRCFWLNHNGLRLSVEMLKASYISNCFWGVLPLIHQHTQHTHTTHTKHLWLREKTMLKNLSTHLQQISTLLEAKTYLSGGLGGVVGGFTEPGAP